MRTHLISCNFSITHRQLRCPSRLKGSVDWSKTIWVLLFENMSFSLVKCMKLPTKRTLWQVSDFFETSPRTHQTSHHTSSSFWPAMMWSIFNFFFILVYPSRLKLCVAISQGLPTSLSLDLYSGNRLSWDSSNNLSFE